MKPRLLPVWLEEEPQDSFRNQLAALIELAGDEVDWLPAARVTDAAGIRCTAVVVPDMSGVAYRLLDSFARIEAPILVISTEFGTVSMWDWEIRDFLRRRGVSTLAPTSLTEMHDLFRALAARERLETATMLAYLDDLGGGKQPDIFKRFFWWEDECVDLIKQQFGTTVERRSFRGLVERANGIPESRVADAVAAAEAEYPISGDVARRARMEALRLKLALSDELDETPGVIAAGINCLNESATSATTPCLAWSMLFEERGLIWGCESDLTSMMTKYLVWNALRTPVMMTNLYPFLLGDAALKHEKIPYFPAADEPENHILAAHCGFFGIVPKSWSTQWEIKPRVLEIVDENAHALDARFPEGDLTIVKITSTLDELTFTPAVLENYEQYANSDCLNGAVLRVEDGYRYVEKLPSHHAVLAVGDVGRRLELVGDALGVGTTRI
ncbi:hypothetical protein ACFOYW_02055 [Gryllotalpicola reticulitermitis]|uniref:L-fucose isomerase n=1 Tax=Gryllotalpicola reticulitermitis TaxID=1184153 RepID=A0ABV8Q353_9MICO